LVTERIFRREEDRLGEQISRANSRTMTKYLPLDAGLGFDHSHFRRFTRWSAGGAPIKYRALDAGNENRGEKAEH
jgi:hypothetical protein